MWHGWSDQLTAFASIKYYEQVEERDAGARDYFRMFWMPGVLHCSGGPGPDTAAWPAAIADWVENSRLPVSAACRVHGQRQHGRRGELRLPVGGGA